MSRYFIQGKGEVQLSQADFKAQGGEGRIYVKGSTAYKIYTDPRRMISPAKINELSVLTQPNIIRPAEVVLDAKNNAVGYAMRHVGNAYALCQLFPKAFRQRKNLTPASTFNLVRQFQEGVRHVHSKGILIVDLNEMNFLVAEDFAQLYFIDVDSYQTPSFPATVLMETVRDRHATGFTTNSDWFSFAVVSFQMFVGIHPFKGTYRPLQNVTDKTRMLDERMRTNISVLRKDVTVPASCLPFKVIPPAYLDWYEAVFEEGKRLPPPDGAQASLVLAAPRIEHHDGSHHFEMTELHEFDSEIIWHDGVITVTQQSIYFGGRKYAKPPFEVKPAVTPRTRHLITAFMGNGQVRFRDLTNGQELATTVAGEEIMLSNGRFYLKQRETLCEVEFIELAQKTLPGVKTVGSVMMKATRMFEGVAMQSLLGACYANIISAPGVCHQIRLRELDRYEIVEAKLCNQVLIVIGAHAGQYDRLVFRFTEDFSDCDVRLTSDVMLTSINFTVLDSGIVLHLTDEDELEVFSQLKGSNKVKVIHDPALQSDAKLFHTGTQALIARGNKLYKLKMRQQHAATQP